MMLQTLLRWRWALIAAAVTIIAFVYAFWPEAVAVEEAKVTRGTMRVGVTDDGVTRVVDRYTVTAPVTGYVSRIELEPGDRVIAGQTIIASMTSVPSPPLDRRTRSELAEALGAARAAETGAQASLDLARSQLGRAQPLAARGFVSRAQLDAAHAAVRLAEADVTRLRAESRRLEAALSEPAMSDLPDVSGRAVAVRAPVNGVILRRLSESEGVLPIGSPLVEIGDPQRIEAVIDLVSDDAAQVRIGNLVEITGWGGGQPIPGRVQRIEPAGRLEVSALGIEEQRVNVVVGLETAGVAGASALGDGFHLEATIILWQRSDVLRVPVGALVRAGDSGWRVFVVDDGVARMREITIRRINPDYAELVSGLKEGETVVLGPAGRIEDGTRIRAR